MDMHVEVGLMGNWYVYRGCDMVSGPFESEDQAETDLRNRQAFDRLIDWGCSIGLLRRT